MTNTEAINELKSIQNQYKGGTEEGSIISEAIDIAIKALEIMKKIPSLITKLEKEQIENTYGDLELVGINKGLRKAICIIQNIVKE